MEKSKQDCQCIDSTHTQQNSTGEVCEGCEFRQPNPNTTDEMENTPRELSLTEKRKIVRQICKLAEKQYRKGFQQGYLASKENRLTEGQVDRFRFDGADQDFTKVIDPHSGRKFDPIDRLWVEMLMPGMSELIDLFDSVSPVHARNGERTKSIVLTELPTEGVDTTEFFETVAIALPELIKAKPEGVFGKWTVSEKGEMSFDNWYDISAEDLADPDWILHLSAKSWVNFNDFIPAYLQALSNKGTLYLVVQVRYDSGL